jgi:cytosine/adenosine deaminase-related metal-dependent hydrolase
MATWEGAQILHRPELGHIRPGAAADVVGISLNRLSLAGGLSDPLAALVFCFIEKVDLSIVAGKILVQNGNLLGRDLSSLISEHNTHAATLLSG